MGAVTRRGRASRSVPYDHEDKHSMRAAAQAIRGGWLEHVDPTRSLSSLCDGDLARLAQMAVTGWLMYRAALAMRGREYDARLILDYTEAERETLLEQVEKEIAEMNRLPTNDEKVQAILDARKDLADYLQSIGKIAVFDEFSKDEICGLIRAAQEGVQRSLNAQAGKAFSDGEIPF